MLSCTPAQKLSKVKATDKLSMPLKLDMASILAMAGAQSLVTGTYEDAQYELMSILIHKGTSASHGHYGDLQSSSSVAIGQWHPCLNSHADREDYDTVCYDSRDLRCCGAPAQSALALAHLYFASYPDLA